MSQKTYFCVASLRDARKHFIRPKVATVTDYTYFVGILIGNVVCTYQAGIGHKAACLNFGTGFTLNQTALKAEMLLNAVTTSVLNVHRYNFQILRQIFHSFS